MPIHRRESGRPSTCTFVLSDWLASCPLLPQSQVYRGELACRDRAHLLKPGTRLVCSPGDHHPGDPWKLGCNPAHDILNGILAEGSMPSTVIFILIVTVAQATSGLSRRVASHVLTHILNGRLGAELELKTSDCPISQTYSAYGL